MARVIIPQAQSQVSTPVSGLNSRVIPTTTRVVDRFNRAAATRTLGVAQYTAANQVNASYAPVRKPCKKCGQRR